MNFLSRIEHTKNFKLDYDYGTPYLSNIITSSNKKLKSSNGKSPGGLSGVEETRRDRLVLEAAALTFADGGGRAGVPPPAPLAASDGVAVPLPAREGVTVPLAASEGVTVPLAARREGVRGTLAGRTAPFSWGLARDSTFLPVVAACKNSKLLSVADP